MRILVCFVLAVLVLSLSVFTPAGAGPDQPIVKVSAATSVNPLLDHINRNMSPLVKKTASYCRRDCDHCRHHCYKKYRVHCQGYDCKKHFVLCMRGCWNNICRWC